MKCHIGVDAGSGLVHTITVTAANHHDVTEIGNLPREDDEVVYGDSGYLGAQKRPEIANNNERFSKIDFRINRRPGRLNSMKGEGYMYQCVLAACAGNSIYEINEMLEANGVQPLGSDPSLQ